ncbi:MAG TPA: octanoyltransferase, partial [Bdellovibrionales bacterium]|nr:octanoyltransferase [Bdellovibrionales bacterium]
MIFEDWGVVEYEASSQRQLEYIERVAETGDERLVFVTHPPVVTLGRATSREEDLIGWSGSLIETSRGGRATYHGPNQIV